MHVSDIKIIHNDEHFNLDALNFPYPVFVDVYDCGTKEGKKKGWALKADWGARLDPFIICYNKDKVVKCFYSEADNNVYKSLINYLNEN